MFCPKCGADGQKAEAYCKRCGQWLPETAGLARRALWGQGIEPERKIRAILVREIVSCLLALAAATILFAISSETGNRRWTVITVAIFCLFVVVTQLDSIFLSLRLRQNFRRSRSETEEQGRLPEQSVAIRHRQTDTSDLAETRTVNEKTTRSLETERLSIPGHHK